MKKFFISLVIIIGLSSATFKVEDTGYFTLKHEILNMNGMNYLVIYGKYTRSSGGVSTSMSVVNVTKDKLECDYYKMMINKR